MPVKDRQGRRLALIIAGATYTDASLQQLRAPGKDASDLAKVLRDPAIGGFDVETLIDAPVEQVKSGIFDFCAKVQPEDLLLLYLSCHGVLDEWGRLYYATINTERPRLGITAVPAEWLNQQLEDCRSRREILILDCCHSGAFAKGAKGDGELGLKERFGGRGKAVLTASGATEYSFEGNTAVGDEVRSVFTHALVEGLRSGWADRDKDGVVSVDDLYYYVYDEVRRVEPRQTPKRWVSNGEGALVVAMGVRGAIVDPVPLSKHIAEVLDSRHVDVRLSGVEVLARFLDEGAPGRGPTDQQKGLAQTARQRLRQISEEDLPRVAARARAALSADPGQAPHFETAEHSGGAGVVDAPLRVDQPSTQAGIEAHAAAPLTPSPPGVGAGDRLFEPDQQGMANLASDPGYVAALDAYFAARWGEAVDLWSALVDRYPDDDRAASRLTDARKSRDLADWYEKADVAAQQGEWAKVVAALDHVVAIDGTYRDATDRLHSARHQAQRHTLRGDLRRLFDAQKWPAVVAAGVRLADLEPDNPDPDGLVAEAKRHLADAELVARHAAGLRQLAESNWEGARDTFNSIELDRPGYRNAAALRERANQHLTQTTVANLHNKLQVAAAAEDWQQVLTLSGELATLDPSAADPDGLATRARTAIHPPRSPNHTLRSGVHVPDPRTIRAGNIVYAVALSPDGTRLATSAGRELQIWDLKTGHRAWEAAATGPMSFIYGLVFSPDGTRLATASTDKSARIWDANTGKELLQVRHQNLGSAVNGVAFCPDGARLATASSDKTARIWDAASGKELLKVGHDGWVNGVVFSPDGTRLATASKDKTARIWDALTGEQLLQVQHDAGVNGVVFSLDGTRLATASKDKTARIWDALTGEQLLQVQHDAGVSAVVFSPDGTRLATASKDKTARIWDAITGNELFHAQHDGSVGGVVFSSDGSRLATGSHDRTARVWGVALGHELLQVRHHQMVNSVDFSPDGTRLATASDDEWARIWDATTGKALLQVRHDDWVSVVVFSPDGVRLATGSNDRTARIWDATTGKELLQVRHGDSVLGVVFSPDGTRLATASMEKTACIWDATTGKEVLQVRHGDAVLGVVFSPDGTRLATASVDDTARIWDAHTRRQLLKVQHLDSVFGVVFSPDGTRLATASDDKTARIWDATTGKELLQVQHDDSVFGVVFCPDGTRLATASDDKKVRIFDAATGGELLQVGHDDLVNGVVFSPDGTLLATASQDKTARIWDVE